MFTYYLDGSLKFFYIDSGELRIRLLENISIYEIDEENPMNSIK